MLDVKSIWNKHRKSRKDSIERFSRNLLEYPAPETYEQFEGILAAVPQEKVKFVLDAIISEALTQAKPDWILALLRHHTEEFLHLALMVSCSEYKHDYLAAAARNMNAQERLEIVDAVCHSMTQPWGNPWAAKQIFLHIEMDNPHLLDQIGENTRKHLYMGLVQENVINYSSVADLRRRMIARQAAGVKGETTIQQKPRM